MSGLLSEEELSTVPATLDTHTSIVPHLRRHIAALEKERDEWRAKAMDVERHPVVVAIRAERDAALADNAAHVLRMRQLHARFLEHGVNDDGVISMLDDLPDAWTQPHPVAALLEEHRKALAHERQRAEMAEAAHAVTTASMKAALVRARNDGL